MKREECTQAKTERCLGKLQKLIPKPEARFVGTRTEQYREEIVTFTLKFVIQGAWMDRAHDSIIILIIVDDWAPREIDVDMRLVQSMATKAIEEELAWMNGVPWLLTVDQGSLGSFQGLSKKNRLMMDLTRPIRRHELKESEVVEVVSEFLAEIRPELADMLLAKHEHEDKGMIRLEGRGLPCPLCLGHLSEDTIFGLFHRIRIERFFHGMEDD